MIHAFFTSLPTGFDILFGFSLGLVAACVIAALKSSGDADAWLATHMPSDPTQDDHGFPVMIRPQVPSGRGGPGNGKLRPNVGRLSTHRAARGGLNGITALQISWILK